VPDDYTCAERLNVPLDRDVMILAESGEVDRRAMDRFRYAPISIVHLSQAIAKIAAWQTPMRLNDTTRTYFERLATLSSPERVARCNGLMNHAKATAIQEHLAGAEPAHHSMFPTSISPNMFECALSL
jgi:hypothetical protein